MAKLVYEYEMLRTTDYILRIQSTPYSILRTLQIIVEVEVQYEARRYVPKVTYVLHRIQVHYIQSTEYTAII